MPINRSVTFAIIISTLFIASCGGGGGDGGGDDGDESSSLQTVGKKLFFDEDLSSDGNQSCASCHDPDFGFADPDVTVGAPVSEVSVAGEFGNRNAPTAAYASFTPDFVKVLNTTVDGTDSNFQGGQFLDGRATDLVEQAKGPFLNPVEMNNTDKAEVVTKVQNASYASEFTDVFGAGAFSDVDQAYDNIAAAIAAFEATSELSPFTSKFDAVMAGNATFTASEQNGFDLFTGATTPDAKCGNCHTVNSPDAAASLFTDFNYYNVGTPINQLNPAYVADNSFRDGGLGDRTDLTPAEQVAEQGKFRTPTLRNVELTAPYMHNGAHETLEEVITHYDLFSDDNIIPEVNANLAEEMAPGLFQPLGLQPQDYIDLENFMLTLTDGYF